MGSDDLALLASAVAPPDPQARRAAADALTASAIDQSALIAALIGKIATLQAQVTQIESVRAELAKLARRLDGAEQLATFRDPYRVSWERPGRIGYFTANSGAFTALTAQTFNKVTITAPATGATLTLANGATLTVPAPGGTLGTAAYKDVASDWAVQKFGCNGAAASGKITVTGSRGGNAALASLLSAMATFGNITDSTTA